MMRSQPARAPVILLDNISTPTTLSSSAPPPRPDPFSPMKHQLKLTGGLFLLAAALSYAAPASENWENLCTKCHGADGKGQTKVGKKLSLKDYTDAKVQAEMKDADMAKAIADGVFADGKEKMKAFKDDLSADEIKDLVAYVRKFKG